MTNAQRTLVTRHQRRIGHVGQALIEAQERQRAKTAATLRRIARGAA